MYLVAAAFDSPSFSRGMHGMLSCSSLTESFGYPWYKVSEPRGDIHSIIHLYNIKIRARLGYCLIHLRRGGGEHVGSYCPAHTCCRTFFVTITVSCINRSRMVTTQRQWGISCCRHVGYESIQLLVIFFGGCLHLLAQLSQGEDYVVLCRVVLPRKDTVVTSFWYTFAHTLLDKECS